MVFIAFRTGIFHADAAIYDVAYHRPRGRSGRYELYRYGRDHYDLYHACRIGIRHRRGIFCFKVAVGFCTDTRKKLFHHIDPFYQGGI